VNMRKLIPRLLILAVAAMMATLVASRFNIVDLPRNYDPLAVPDLDETPHWLTTTQLKLVDLETENCRAALKRTRSSVAFLQPKGLGTDCERSGTVELSLLSTARIRPEETRCNIAARLYMWEKHAVQPAARKIFNEPVAEILHFGSYNCRPIAGSSFMSEHATANAFDISGFRLKSGRIVSLLKHWNGTAQERAFLHAVRDGACDYFNVTLSPDYNTAHRDHFHVDMGWYRSCN
jgi:hypothetical protein